jgi:hypothetical protein
MPFRRYSFADKMSAIPQTKGLRYVEVTYRLPKSCIADHKIGGASSRLVVNTRSMDQDSKSKIRFCWPAQDRARAESPSKAPRNSSVFTASVCFRSVAPVPVPQSSIRLRGSMLTSRIASSRVMRNRFGGVEVGCGCSQIGFPGQAPLSWRKSNESLYELTVPEVVKAAGSGPRESGVALGFQWNADVACEGHSPDWRVMGEQDTWDTA